jgi:hypothetical protein
MAQTMADQLRARRKDDYEDAAEFLDLILEIDDGAVCETIEGRAVIIFTDKSRYTIGGQ